MSLVGGFWASVNVYQCPWLSRLHLERAHLERAANDGQPEHFVLHCRHGHCITGCPLVRARGQQNDRLLRAQQKMMMKPVELKALMLVGQRQKSHPLQSSLC